MNIDRETFLTDLEMVKAGLSPREFIEQSSCFVFQRGEVMTFNDEIACRKEVGLKVTGAVTASTLLDILGKLNDTELEVLENDQGELEFRGAERRFGCTKDAEVFLPIDRVENPKNWVPLAEGFTQAVDKVARCVSTDESRFILTCVHLHPDFVEACDNLQLMRVKMKTGLEKSALVRGSSLSQIVLLGMNEMALGKSWVHFRNKAGLVFSCRKFDDEYPVLDKLMKFEGDEVELPRTLVEVSDRAEVFATDKSGDPLIEVTLSKGKEPSKGVITITGRGLSGWYKEKKSVKYNGPKVMFFIAPVVLQFVAEKYQDAVLGGNKLRASGPSWRYVTVLSSRPEEEEQGEAPPKK